MHIWVDADACPAVIKEILFRAAERAQIALTLVANQPLRTPRSPLIRTLQVPRGFDVADNEIAKRLAPGDLVISADIPLAADWQRDHLAVVAFVQELRGRTILASASVPLKNVRP